MKKRTLGFKLVVGGILAVLIPLVVVGLFSVSKASKALADGAKEQSSAIARDLATLTESAMANEVKFVRELAGLAVSRDALSRLVEGGETDMTVLTAQLAATFSRNKGDYEAIVAIDRDGKVVADGIGGKTVGIVLTDRDYFTAAKKGTDHYRVACQIEKFRQPDFRGLRAGNRCRRPFCRRHRGHHEAGCHFRKADLGQSGAGPAILFSSPVTARFWPIPKKSLSSNSTSTN